MQNNLLQMQQNHTNIFLEKVLDSVKIGIVSLNADYLIQMVNIGFLNIFGYNEEQVLNRSIDILFNSHDYNILRRHMQNANYPKSVISIPKYELNGFRKDKTIIQIEITISKKDVDKNHIYILIIRDISEFKQTVDDLKYLAYFDQLTKVPNRTLFLDRAETAIRQARRSKERLAIVYIDLDDFKIINDTMGHEAGDMILKELSKRFLDCARESDTVSRLGGDEFTILMPKISHIDDTSKLANRILESNNIPIKINDNNIFPKTSLGVSIFPEDGNNINILLKNADTAMYTAKQKGKNQFLLYNTKMK